MRFKKGDKIARILDNGLALEGTIVAPFEWIDGTTWYICATDYDYPFFIQESMLQPVREHIPIVSNAVYSIKKS